MLGLTRADFQADGRLPEINHFSDQARDLLYWWPLTDGDDGVAREVVQGNHARFQGDAAWDVARDSDIGAGGFVSNTSGDGILAGSVREIFDWGIPWTISGWYRIHAHLGGYQTFFGTRYPANRGVNMRLNTGGLADFHVAFFGVQEVGFTNTRALVAGQWHHIALVYTGHAGDSVTLYSDGRQNGDTMTIGHIQSGTGTDLWTIGAWENRGNGVIQGLNGEEADHRIYGRALSAEEIRQHFDPATRWDLYARRRHVSVPAAPPVGGDAMPQAVHHDRMRRAA